MSEVDLNSLGVEFEGDWDPGDQIIEAVLIAKVAKLDSGGTSLLLGNTPGIDWIAQRGLISAAQHVLDSAEEA